MKISVMNDRNFDIEKADKIAKLLVKLGIKSEQFMQDPEKYIKMAMSQLSKNEKLGDM